MTHPSIYAWHAFRAATMAPSLHREYFRLKLAYAHLWNVHRPPSCVDGFNDWF